MKKCNRCNKEFDLEQDFCPSCGSFDLTKVNNYVENGKLKTSTSTVGVLLVLFFFFSLTSVFLFISTDRKTIIIILFIWFLVFLFSIIKILFSLILNKVRKKGNSSEKM